MTDFYSVLLFLYFATLHADRLSLTVGGYTIRINNLLAALLSGLFFLRFRNHLFQINKNLAYPLIAILLSITLSALFSPYKERCFFYLSWYVLTVFCYFLLPYFLIKLWDSQKVFTLYFASFIFVGGYATLQLLLSCCGIHDPFAQQFLMGRIVRPNAMCYEPSYYALYLTPFVFMYNTYYLTDSQQPLFMLQKSLPLLLLINGFYIVTTSTAIFFAYVVFFTLAFFFPAINRKRLVKFILSFATSAALVILALPTLAKHVYLKFFFQGFITHHSFHDRWVGLVNGWYIFLKQPLLGVGLGGYSPYLFDVFLMGRSEFNFLHIHTMLAEYSNPVKLFEAMNVTTELLASLGLVGFCAFSYLLFNATLLGFKKQQDSIAFSLFLSIIVTFVVLQFNQGLLRTYLWVHLAMAIAYFEKVSSAEPQLAIS